MDTLCGTVDNSDNIDCDCAISTTLVGRHSCTSEWQGHKAPRSSLTNLRAVILVLSVSTITCKPSQRSLFPAWVCFSVAFSTVFHAFLTTFLIDSSYKNQFKTWKKFSRQVLKFYTHQNKISFSWMVIIDTYQNYKGILWNAQWTPIVFVLNGQFTTKMHQFYIRFSCWIKLHHW